MRCQVVFDDKRAIEAEELNGFHIKRSSGGFTVEMVDYLDWDEKTLWIIADVHKDLLSSGEKCVLCFGVRDEFTSSDEPYGYAIEDCDAIYELDLTEMLIGHAAGYESLQVGSKGENVKALQRKLIELGCLGGSADGAYGNGTAKGVQAFQAAEGLPETGVADVLTQVRLFAK